MEPRAPSGTRVRGRRPPGSASQATSTSTPPTTTSTRKRAPAGEPPLPTSRARPGRTAPMGRTGRTGRTGRRAPSGTRAAILPILRSGSMETSTCKRSTMTSTRRPGGSGMSSATSKVIRESPVPMPGSQEPISALPTRRSSLPAILPPYTRFRPPPSRETPSIP